MHAYLSAFAKTPRFGVVATQLRVLLLWLVLAKASCFLCAQATATTDTILGNAYSLDAYVVLTDVVIEGNRKTRESNVLREMQVRVGDTVYVRDFKALLKQERLYLLNTNLFSEVQVLVSTFDAQAHTTVLRAVVREKWYFYPAVTFDLADRNFNVWWNEQDASLDRVNFGAKLKHGNFTGRGDKLTFFVQAGYTRKAEIKYQLPYINKAKTVGLELSMLTDRNREWGTNTEGGLLTFLDLDSVNVLRRQRYRVALSFRRGIFLEQFLRIELQSNGIAEQLGRENNPNFFGDGRLQQDFIGLRYYVRYDKRDVRPFPERGYYIEGIAEKLGLSVGADINRLNLSLEGRTYTSFTPRISMELRAKVHTDVVRTRIPYFNRTSLGFGSDFIRGFQFYIADGLDFAYLKSTLRYKLIDRELKFPFIPIQRLSKVPFKFYVAAHSDAGGINDPFSVPGNVLANRVLTSYGVGVYGVFFYGKVVSFEFTRNDLGEAGAFLSYSLGF